MSRDLQEPGGNLLPGVHLPGLQGGATRQFTVPSPELILPHSLPLLSSGGSSNVGVPTLTTPTLTPTTLRNIEQMFAECDPTEPPHHHENAAGFVPPIISPTSGNSYTPLGLNLSTNGDKEPKRELDSPPLPAQSRLQGPDSPPLLAPSRPHLFSKIPTLTFSSPDLPTSNFPTVSRPQSLTITASRPQSLTIRTSRHPPPLTLSPSCRQSLSISLTSRPQTLYFADTSGPENLSLSRPESLDLSMTRQQTRPQHLVIPSPKGPQHFRSEAKNIFFSGCQTRPQDLSISRSGEAGGGGLPAQNIEFLEKFLKAAAASSPMLNTPTSAMISPVKEFNTFSRSAISPTPRNRSPCPPDLPSLFIAETRSVSPPRVMVLSPPPRYRNISGESETSGFLEDDDKKALRRERNKQAAARCRKRRLDLTLQLQEEVSDWEKNNRSLKEELMDLEEQKKGLESVLLRHSGPCKVSKKC